jgi:hypothetical protein
MIWGCFLKVSCPIKRKTWTGHILEGTTFDFRATSAASMRNEKRGLSRSPVFLHLFAGGSPWIHVDQNFWL